MYCELAGRRSPSRMLFPDPTLTASLYCAGRLDDLVHVVLGPVWSALREGEAGGSSYLWFMRYGRGGEHLKIRFHGPPAASAGLASLLPRAAATYFSSLPAADLSAS